MTAPKPETIKREKGKLYLTDAELIRRLGVPRHIAKTTIKFYEDKGGFPPKQKMFGGRRYWPSVQAWLDKQNGLTLPSDQPRRLVNGR